MAAAGVGREGRKCRVCGGGVVSARRWPCEEDIEAEMMDNNEEESTAVETEQCTRGAVPLVVPARIRSSWSRAPLGSLQRERVF